MQESNSQESINLSVIFNFDIYRILISLKISLSQIRVIHQAWRRKSLILIKCIKKNWKQMPRYVEAVMKKRKSIFKVIH